MRNLSLAAIVVLAACGDTDGPTPPADLDVIATTPVAGTIAGTPFSLGTRYMNVSGSDLFVDLLPTANPDCTTDETSRDYPFVIFFTMPTPGTYPLGDTQFLTMVPAANQNLVVGQGVIQIDEVSATTVRGGLHVWDPEFGELNGRFDGQLCFRN